MNAIFSNKLSVRSTASGTSTASIPREDQDVYLYALRVAVLEDTIRLATSIVPPVVDPAASVPGTGRGGGARHAHTSSKSLGSFRPADGWTRSLFSLSGIFKDANSKEDVKFPKEFLKALDARIAKIVSSPRPDPVYPDAVFKELLQGFFPRFREDGFQRRVKINRQMEELILTFVTTSSSILKRKYSADGPGGTQWKEELDKQVGLFTMFARDCLRAKGVKNVNQALLERLDAHCAKLEKTQISTPPSQPGAASTSITRTSSTTLDPSSLRTNLNEMPLVMAVGKIFGKSEQDLKRDTVVCKRNCDDKNAYKDLKLLINNVAQGAKFPLSADDFETDESYQRWKKDESAALSAMLMEIVKRDPNLLQSAYLNGNLAVTEVAARQGLPKNNPYGSSNPSSVVSEEETSEAAFHFIPPDPQYYYKRLFEIALDYDYDQMSNLPPDEYVSLTILSSIHEDLLKACEQRWRVIEPVKEATFAFLIMQYYKTQRVPEACVMEAVNGIDRVLDGWELERWPVYDRQFLYKTYRALFDLLLTRFWEIFEGVLDLPFVEVVNLLDRLYFFPLLHPSESPSRTITEAAQISSSEIRARLVELEIGMKKWVEFAYEEKMSDLDSLPRENDLQTFIGILVWIEKETKGYQKLFKQPVVDYIDPPAIFIGVAAPEFVRHMEASRTALLAAASQTAGAGTDEDILALYRGVTKLRDIHQAFCPGEQLAVDFSAWFEPYVRRWLVTTDAKTMEWVKRAIASDRFEPELHSEDVHSTSIIDLIASCRSAADFILALNWPNEVENAKYLTAISQTISKSIEQYSHMLESLFMQEIFPEQPVNEDSDARPSAWLTKARIVMQGDKKLEAFVFETKTLVKLNNIQAARKLLDRMYTTLDADKVASIIKVNQNSIPFPQKSSKFLFTTKIVLSENLFAPDGSTRRKLDPFCILSDHVGNRVAKTRTLYETGNPRWDETFDVSVRGDLWLRATVYNRNLVDEHDILGRAYLHLNPAEFSDFLPRDVWLQLENTSEQKIPSRLLLRISMEGEKDDIQFFFGRAFRALKRAESDMARTIVDKMSPFVRNYISITTLKALVKTSYNFDIDLERVRGDLTKATGRINALMRDTFSNQERELIPEVGRGSNGASKSDSTKRKKGPLTDAEIEEAIMPLFEYFDDTFGLLSSTLSPSAWELVSSKLWKEILTTIEALILPPLSDQPTDMKPLSERELDVVFKWLEFLVDFFHAGGNGLPLSMLKNGKYQELGMARMYYDWNVDVLCEEAVRAMQRQLSRPDKMSRRKSVYNQRNLGTIKARKVDKQQAETSNGEIVLRILRMHPGQTDFIAGQINALNMPLLPPPIPVKRAGGNVRGGHSNGRGNGMPAVPSIPAAYR